MQDFCVRVDKLACDERLLVCVAKYRRLRRHTHELLEEEVLRAFRQKIRVTSLNSDALSAVKSVWMQQARRVAFNWEGRICPTLVKSHPRRLELALWVESELCGLAVARLSDAREWVSLTHIEGAPNPSHPLRGKVVPIALIGADIFGTLVQAEAEMAETPKVRILNPLRESMDWYERCGYSQLIRENGYTYAVPKEEP